MNVQQLTDSEIALLAILIDEKLSDNKRIVKVTNDQNVKEKVKVESEKYLTILEKFGAVMK